MKGFKSFEGEIAHTKKLLTEAMLYKDTLRLTMGRPRVCSSVAKLETRKFKKNNQLNVVSSTRGGSKQPDCCILTLCNVKY